MKSRFPASIFDRRSAEQSGKDIGSPAEAIIALISSSAAHRSDSEQVLL